MTTGAQPPALINAFTIDVEEYFHVSAFTPFLSRLHWERMEGRVNGSTRRLLGLLDAHGVHATFFILGWVARRSPQLVREIAGLGHEIASHGLDHVPVQARSPQAFRKEARESKRLLEDVCGQEVKGFRATSFSINENNRWAFDELENAGYRYSSSVNPIRHDHYGWPDAPRRPFHPTQAGALLEIPITTVRFFNRNYPLGGGGFFRLYPYALFRLGLRRIHAEGGSPCVFYCHPWELDPAQPRPPGLGLKSRFRHYLNLEKTEDRLHRLLSDFRWGRMDRAFGLTET